MIDPAQQSTIPALWAATVATADDHQAALGAIQHDELSWQSWAEVGREVQRLAASIVAAGIQPGDRVGHVSENRREWIIADLAIHLSRGVHVPIHATLPVPRIIEQILHASCRLVFVSTETLAGQLARGIDSGTLLVVYDPLPQRRSLPLPFTHLEEFMSDVSDDQAEDTMRTALRKSKADDLATILYTSGTTGRPRGVMLSQQNITGNAVATTSVVGGDPRETRLCFLPLSHIYARTCDLYSWVCLGSQLVLAESRDTIMRDCQQVQPTAINAVPYFYQKVHDRVRAAGGGDESAVLSRALGGRIHQCFCGGAALAPEVEQWFAERGLPILPGYGLTETSPVVTASTKSARRAGTVGRPLPNVEVRIALDGEVLVRGPNVMRGYYRDEDATSEVIRDGWLYTGDLGTLDGDGFLTIYGRKKEIIVLSTGKKVSPTRVEGLLAASPLVEQIAVVGDGRSHLAAIIVPAAEPLRAEIRRRRILVWSRSQALRSQKVRAIFAEEIARRLSEAAREEQVHAFTLVGRGFSVEKGEVTPKFSLCRSVLEKAFHSQITDMYRKQRQ